MDVVATVDVGPGAGGAAERWQRAVRLGGEGRYAAAEALLCPLRGGPGVPPVVRAHAAVTRASHLRQVGAHAPAGRLDAAAARLARTLVPGAPRQPDVAGTGPGAAFGDALTGLAADALGRWDVATAERLLDRAAPWCGVPRGPTRPGGRDRHPAGPDGAAAPDLEAPPPTRTAVRWLWVRAETSLVRGDAAGAIRAAGLAVRPAGTLGSPRHELKSRLVHAVARAAGGEPVVAELDAIAEHAGATGLLPLRWPALLAAADALDRDGRHAGPSPADTVGRQTVAQSRRHAAMLTTSVLHLRSDPVARVHMRESPWIPTPGAVPY